MKEIGIYLNTEKPASLDLARLCMDYLMNNDIQVAFLDGQMAMRIPDGVVAYNKRDFFSKPDAIVVLGGDGTLLYVARKTAKAGIPLFGINLGKLGFLTEGESGSFRELLSHLLSGAYYIEERMMLSCTIKRQGEVIHQGIALNDVLIKNGFRMMDIRAYSDGNLIDKFRADGLIVSSPTGSTGYSLAAGGPIVAPGTDILIINPICPHRLHDRAYVISATNNVFSAAFLPEERDISVSLDGQVIFNIEAADVVSVEKAPYKTKLVRLNGMDFFKRLRNKLTEEIRFDKEDE